ncbi:hypothetical protein [Sorangium sp. So ce887]|uniref:hypothetical protein n=1 Tax=Sorangium sp. So ce887 TaxID=3133324 RepID=UPI003F5DE78E
MDDARATLIPEDEAALWAGEGTYAPKWALPPRVSPDEKVPRELLVQPRGNVAAAARELGRDRAQVHRWPRRYNTNIDELR